MPSQLPIADCRLPNGTLDCAVIPPRRSASQNPAFHSGLLCLTVVLFVLGMLPASSVSQSQLPEPVRNVGIDPRLNEQMLRDLEFRDEEGRVVTIGQLRLDKPVVLSLVYHECSMLCSEVLEGMLRAFRVLRFDAGKEFEVLTVCF